MRRACKAFHCFCLLAVTVMVSSCAPEAAPPAPVSSKKKKTDVVPLLDDKKLFDFDPGYDITRLEKFSEILAAAQDALDHSAYPEADELLKKAIKKNPTSGKAHYLRGICLSGKIGASPDSALKEFNTALRLGYEDFKLYDHMATAYESKNDFKGAIDALSRGIVFDRTARNLYKYRAALYDKIGDFENAEKDYDTVIEMSSEDKLDNALIARGAFYQRLKRYDEALRDYGEALKHLPEGKSPALRKRSALLIKLGRHQEALPDLTAMLAEHPTDEDTLKLRGDTYFALGRNSEALNDYSKVIELSPDFARTSYEGRARVYEKLGESELSRKDMAEARRLYERPAEKPVYEIKED
ncbi:MAG: tetratricopeptide repeat protein [Cyanobacteria bacterium HKST-UBA02]|nr:tetratricopeptide repeat protein [Cyanobacteria bacterium HKST-UBA02]